MPLSDLFAHPQAQSRADVFLCSKKRLEDVFDIFCRNSWTVIFDPQLDQSTFAYRDRRRFDFKVPPMGTASIAFEMMFEINCCISPAKPVIAGHSSRAS